MLCRGCACGKHPHRAESPHLLSLPRLLAAWLWPLSTCGLWLHPVTSCCLESCLEVRVGVAVQMYDLWLAPSLLHGASL